MHYRRVRTAIYGAATMPLQVSKHTREQRAAAVAASLEPDATIIGVCADAAAGRLTYRRRVLAPFELNVSTLKSWRQRDIIKHRAQQLAAADPASAVDLLEGRLALLAGRKLAELEQRAAKDVHPGELREIARALREIRSLRHAPKHNPGKPARSAEDAREQLAAEQAAVWAADAT